MNWYTEHQRELDIAAQDWDSLLASDQRSDEVQLIRKLRKSLIPICKCPAGWSFREHLRDSIYYYHVPRNVGIGIFLAWYVLVLAVLTICAGYWYSSYGGFN